MIGGFRGLISYRGKASISKDPAPLISGSSTGCSAAGACRSTYLRKCSGYDRGEGVHVSGIPQAAVGMTDSSTTAPN